jgi:hypothetical protein
VRKFVIAVLSAGALLVPSRAFAQEPSDESPAASVEQSTADQQSNVPVAARQAEDATERVVRRFRVGVDAAVGVDPELIMFGAHGSFGPIFRRGIDFRPGVELGVGEVTTMFGINLDVLYTLAGGGEGRWSPYIGAGPNFALSHRGFEADQGSLDQRNRFDFSDTDFAAGMNFIAGVRHRNVTMEMKATAYGVSNVRLLVGYNF